MRTRVWTMSRGAVGTREAREAIAEAVACLSSGGLVAVPTETVYGLAVDATDAEAVARVFEVKARPRFDPLIVHLPSVDWLERVASAPAGAGGLVDRLVEMFWPGPLTLVLERCLAVPEIVAAGLPTLAVRMSSHPVLAALLRGFGRPIAAPSANRFGRISPTTAEHVVAELGGWIPMVLDAGPTEHGVESTVVRPVGGHVEILRPGPVTAEMLGAVAPVLGAPARDPRGRPVSPGRLDRHYAPDTPLVIGRETTWPEGVRRGLLAWSGEMDDGRFERVEWLSRRRDLREAGAGLFSALRRLDGAGLELIVAEPVPEEGLGRAIMDRLRRAEAARLDAD